MHWHTHKHTHSPVALHKIATISVLHGSRSQRCTTSVQSVTLMWRLWQHRSLLWHVMCLGLHAQLYNPAQRFAEIPKRTTAQCCVKRLEDTHHEFHSAPGLFSITTLISQLQTNCLGRQMSEREREAIKKIYHKQSEAGDKKGGSYLPMNVTEGVISGDVASLREKAVKKKKNEYVKMTTPNMWSLNHGAAGRADIPICLLCHWSKLAFMRLPSM